MSSRNLILFTVTSFLMLSGCTPPAEPEEVTPEARAIILWSYEGEEGPAHWADLRPDFVACSDGAEQSPIDITSPTEEDLTSLIFTYQPSLVNLVNNGHTIQVNYEPGSFVEKDSVRFDLLQFHFHAPSEHAINGELAAAEVHLVHQSADGVLAVVGILIEEGAENPAFQSFWNSLPATAGPAEISDSMVNAAEMLPSGQTTYRYMGSLTTPPCSEGVHWNVMVEPIQMSADQLAAFTNLFEGNNRPLQALGSRTVVTVAAP